MIKRIDLFMPPHSQYDALHHFTTKLYEALVRIGVNCRLLTSEKNNPRPFLTKIFEDPPDCTLSFNGLLPDAEDHFLCDMLKIPHVCCLVDSPNRFFPLIKSSYNIITCVDQNACDFFKDLNHENTLFMPHAVEKNLVLANNKKRTIDILLLASFIDYESIGKQWKEKYPRVLATTLFEAAERTLTSMDLSFVDSLVQGLEDLAKRDHEIRIDSLDFISMLDDLEMYIRGFERVQLIKSIKDARIDIYGHSKEEWENCLKNCSNCVFHDAVPFDEALTLMQQAKIVLNSCAWIKTGGHERIFSAMASEAVAVVSKNSYLSSHFQDQQDLLYYENATLNQLEGKINHLLENENARKSIAEAGRQKVMHHHTWDNRATQLIKELGAMLEVLPKAQTQP